jgi:hypothetical protein
MPNTRRGRNDLNESNNAIPLLYRSLSTRRASYPQYIMLKNGDTPIAINRRYLGNDNCMALLLSGHAVAVPPMVNDIADALYWLQNILSPPLLRCTLDFKLKLSSVDILFLTSSPLIVETLIHDRHAPCH